MTAGPDFRAALAAIMAARPEYLPDHPDMQIQ